MSNKFKIDHSDEMQKPPPADFSTARDVGQDNAHLLALIKEMEKHQIDMEEQNKYLRRSIKLYQDLYNSAPVGFLTLDKDLKIIGANLTLAYILGVDCDSLVGTSVLPYFTPSSHATLYLHVRRTLTSHSRQSVELQLLKKDNSSLDVRLDSVPVYNEDGSIGFCRIAITDISERKRIEETLRITQEELIKLLDAIPIPISITSMPDETILEVNNAFLQHSGYERHEIIEKKGPDLSWKDADIARQISQDLLGKGILKQREVELYSKSGELRTSLLSAQKIKLGDKEAIVAVSLDITNRKKMEEALRESENFNSHLLDNSPNPVLVSNPDTSIRYVNTALEKLTGFSSKELIGRKVPYPWWPEEKIPQYLEKSDFSDTKEVVIEERQFVRKTGETFWANIRLCKVEEKGSISCYIANWVDITETRRFVERLKTNELELQTILDSLTEGVSLIRMDGSIARANKAEANLMNLRSKAQKSKHYFRNQRFNYVYPDGTSIPLEESAVIKAIKKKNTIHNYEVGVIKEDGSTLWLNVNAVPVKNSHGNIIGIVRTSMDITEQKKLQDEKEQFTMRLLAVQEEERKRISRELHDDTAQYLALLKLEMDALVEKEQQIPPQTLDRLRKMQITINRTLDEVRRFSHELRPSVLEHFGLTSALELIISEFKSTCSTDIKFTVEGSDRRLADNIELALFRIAQEAMSNIRKHSGATMAEIKIKFTPHEVRLTITDNGKGFISGQKSSGIPKGSLGLVGMRERAHLIGASLKVRSRPAVGTVVSVVVKTD